ncbi:glycosyltransferase family 2 protein [Seonamhaeicola maritimus]|uniref:glycosyltransferase family 2 protein n=1 Tax=Seonamhaeicola maritimus TaxID=2591822 RepID=UPI002494DA09|nr:glycosyltransferase family A protein [Seonamhaeicola maritimus]
MISVIVPCYNQAQYLAECLQSILSQTYSDWECVVVNDGSPDHTPEVVNGFLKLDKRFKYIEIENGGVSHARNVGIKESKGKYILPLDADDKIGPKYLELGLRAFNKDNRLKVVYCEAHFFGTNNKLWSLPSFTFEELLKNNIIFCSGLFKKEDCVKVGGYDTNLSIGLEDWEFWINLLKDGGEVFRIPEVCFFYRIKELSRNSRISEDEFEEALKYISIKHSNMYVDYFGSFQSLLEKNRELTVENIRLKKINKLSLVSMLKKLKIYING